MQNNTWAGEFKTPRHRSSLYQSLNTQIIIFLIEFVVKKWVEATVDPLACQPSVKRKISCGCALITAAPSFCSDVKLKTL